MCKALPYCEISSFIFLAQERVVVSNNIKTTLMRNVIYGINLTAEPVALHYLKKVTLGGSN